MGKQATEKQASTAGKTSKKSSGFYNWVTLLIILGIVIFLNIIGTFIYSRIDMTEDERYSLSDGTISFLETFNKESKESKGKEANRIYLKIYLEGEMPAEIRRFRNAIETKLQEFKEIAGDRLEYEFINPDQGSDAEKRTLYEALYQKGKGIIPLEVVYQNKSGNSQKMFWPGAEIVYEGTTKQYIQFLPGTSQGQPRQLTKDFSESIVQNSINNLEYMLISGLRKTIIKSRPRIAFLQGHGELSEAETMRIRTLLDPYYSIENVSLNNNIHALDAYKGVIIAGPKTPYSEKDLYLVDQFVMKGGSLMCFYDMLKYDRDTLLAKGSTFTSRTDLGLDKLLFSYGIKTNADYVLEGTKCGPILLPYAKNNLLPWFFYVGATPGKHAISRNIETVMLRYCSQIELIPNDSYLCTPILTSSNNSRTAGLTPTISLGMPMNFDKIPVLVDDPNNEGNRLCLSGLTEGRYESYFKSRLIDEFAKNPESGYIAESKKEGKVLAIANGTFIRNYYDSAMNAEGKMVYYPTQFNNLRLDEEMARMRIQPMTYGNQEFMQNMVDYMLGDNSVLDVRSKQIELHPLDKSKVEQNSSFLTILNVVVPSLLVIGLALILFVIRKRRYAR